MILDELGLTALYAGDPAGARALFRESLTLCREIGERWSSAECLVGLAALAALDGDAARLRGCGEWRKHCATPPGSEFAECYKRGLTDLLVFSSANA